MGELGCFSRLETQKLLLRRFFGLFVIPISASVLARLVRGRCGEMAMAPYR